MPRLIPSTALLLSVLLLGACQHQPSCHCVECPAMDDDRASVYRHVVAFKFKDTTTPTQIDQIVAAFSELEEKIDVITAFEHGQQVSPEGFDQGYTHVFIVTFEDRAGLDVYLPHPAHKAFVEQLLPLLAPPPFVVDYMAE